MYNPLRQRGQEFGIVFGNYELLSNTRLALEASEYARDRGRHPLFHEQMFRAYFTEARDIGDAEVIASIAADCGLDAGDLTRALAEKRYSHRLEEARQEGERISLTSIPTFIINDEHRIVGAQSVKVFQSLLGRLESKGD